MVAKGNEPFLVLLLLHLFLLFFNPLLSYADPRAHHVLEACFHRCTRAPQRERAERPSPFIMEVPFVDRPPRLLARLSLSISIQHAGALAPFPKRVVWLIDWSGPGRWRPSSRVWSSAIALSLFSASRRPPFARARWRCLDRANSRF